MAPRDPGPSDHYWLDPSEQVAHEIARPAAGPPRVWGWAGRGSGWRTVIGRSDFRDGSATLDGVSVAVLGHLGAACGGVRSLDLDHQVAETLTGGHVDLALLQDD